MRELNNDLQKVKCLPSVRAEDVVGETCHEHGGARERSVEHEDSVPAGMVEACDDVTGDKLDPRKF
jgi:hypothetical protein